MAGSQGFKKREMVAEYIYIEEGEKQGADTDEEVKREPGLWRSTPAFPTIWGK